jgi:pimeloyl-ACP methyl ester carboxylesterase
MVESTAGIEREQYLRAYNRALSLWPVPYREINVETVFGKAHIIASGPENAPPIVLLHGMNASSTMWYPNIEELSRDYTVYAIDNLTEPGKSEMIRKVGNIKDMVSWYAEILDKLQIQQFTLIGASKGGWLAVNLALHLQDRVKKLILLSPLQTFSFVSPGTKILSAIKYAMNPNRHNLGDVLNTMSTNVPQINTLYIDQFYLGTKISDPVKLLKNFVPYTRKALRKLKMPVLVLIGDEDIINKKSVVLKASHFIPQVEISVVPHAGHFLSMDQTKITDGRIMDFINSERLSQR